MEFDDWIKLPPKKREHVSFITMPGDALTRLRTLTQDDTVKGGREGGGIDDETPPASE